MRKLISILLAVLLVASMTLGAAALPVPKMLLAAVGEGESEDTYAVAGSEAELFTKTWGDGIAENPMTKNDDGTYSRTYTVTKAYNDVQLKAVKNGSTWIGDETGNNVTFNLTGAGEFTVYCDGTKTWVEGEIVAYNEGLVIQSVTAVGNGIKDGDGWLNNQVWDPAAASNHMTKVADGVYKIEFTIGEYDPDNIEFKFAINDAWTHNFGLADNGTFENGVTTDAIYNGSKNLKIEGVTAGTTVKMYLDLTGFNFDTKTGAKMTIIWSAAEESTVAPTEANTDEPTVAPTEVTTDEPTVAPTEAPTDEPTIAPTEAPTDEPTVAPTEAPTDEPTVAPTEAPTDEPTVAPTEAPTDEPTVAPTDAPIVGATSYYLIGTMTGWQVSDDYKLTANADAEGEYVINGVHLALNDQFKVVSYTAGTADGAQVWYPSGMGNNYGQNGEITAAGDYNIYFRPDGQGGDDWFNKVIYVELVTADPTEAPTEAPTDTEPSTEEATTDTPAEDTYAVAGSEAELFTKTWGDGIAENPMTKNDDGTYSRTYTVTKAYNDVQLKAVKNGSTWIGDETGNNVTFNLTGAGEFTVYCDGTKTWVEGEIVAYNEGLDIQSVTAVGNGIKDGDGWLNNQVWDPAAASNHMTKVADGVYEIEFTIGKYDPDNLEFKFAINDAWTHNFGLADNGTFENGVTTDAIYNGSKNLKIEGVTAGTTVKMYLDLAGFNFDTKTGAKMTIIWSAAEEPTVAPTEANTDEPTVAPTEASTDEPTVAPTEAPTDEPTVAPTEAPTDEPTVAPTEPAPTEPPTEAPTEQPLQGKSYYLTGSFTEPVTGNAVNWDLHGNMILELVEDGLYKFEGLVLRTTDAVKAVQSSKRGNDISVWYPDGMDNNQAVEEDGIYTVYFRPNGDGTAEDGWNWIHYEGDGDGCSADGDADHAANHGATRGGFMFKFVKTGEAPEIPVSKLKGDVDGDGEVSIYDASIIQKYLAGIDPYKELSEQALKNADVDGDGEVSVFDASYIQRAIAGMDDGYGIVIKE